MLLEKGVCYDHYVLMTNLCQPCLTWYSKTKLTCYSTSLLTFYPCIPIPYDEKDILFLFLVLVLENVVILHRTGELKFLRHSGWGIDIDYCDIEWFVLEIN